MFVGHIEKLSSG